MSAHFWICLQFSSRNCVCCNLKLVAMTAGGWAVKGCTATQRGADAGATQAGVGGERCHPAAVRAHEACPWPAATTQPCILDPGGAG